MVCCWSGQCASLICTTASLLINFDSFANLCKHPPLFFFNSLGKRQRARKHPHRPLPPGNSLSQSPSAGTASSSPHHHVTTPQSCSKSPSLALGEAEEKGRKPEFPNNLLCLAQSFWGRWSEACAHQNTLVTPGYCDAAACTPFPDPSRSGDPDQALCATVQILPTAPALGADPLGSLPRAKNSENSGGGGQPSRKQASYLILGPT